MLSFGGQAEGQALDFIEKLEAEHRTRILSIFRDLSLLQSPFKKVSMKILKKLISFLNGH